MCTAMSACCPTTATTATILRIFDGCVIEPVIEPVIESADAHCACEIMAKITLTTINDLIFQFVQWRCRKRKYH